MSEKTPEKRAGKFLLQNPNEKENYKNLINELFKLKAYEKAKAVNQASLNHFPFDLDLLIQNDILYLKINEEKITKILIVKWEKIAKKYKNYRDAYLNLAFLNLKIGKKNKAKKNLEVVKKINPNFELLSKFNL